MVIVRGSKGDVLTCMGDPPHCVLCGYPVDHPIVTEDGWQGLQCRRCLSSYEWPADPPAETPIDTPPEQG
jgi:hypothetical protein